MEKYLPKMYKNLMEIYKEVGTENEEESINEQYNLIEGISVDFGIKDLIVVDAGDVLLVMDKNKDQELKYLVNQIKEEKKYDDYL